jgi:hypothetical protein
MKIDTIRNIVDNFNVDQENANFKQKMKPSYADNDLSGELLSWSYGKEDPARQINFFAYESRTGRAHKRYLKLNKCAGTIEETKEKFRVLREEIIQNGVTYEVAYIGEIHLFCEFISLIQFEKWQTILEALVQVEKENSTDKSKMFFAKDNDNFNSFRAENNYWGIRIYNKHDHVEQSDKKMYGGVNPYEPNTVRVEIYIKKFKEKIRLEDLTEQMLDKWFKDKLSKAMKNIFTTRREELLGYLAGSSAPNEVVCKLIRATSRDLSLAGSLLTRGDLEAVLNTIFANDNPSTRRTKKQRVLKYLSAKDMVYNDKRILDYLDANNIIYDELSALLQ